MAVEHKLYSVDEFEAFIRRPENKNRLLELIHGEIVEKAPTEEHGNIVFIIAGEIYAFLKSHSIEAVGGVEVQHRVPGDEHNARIPDLSVRTNISVLIVEKGAVPQMPDLAVEIQSPDDSLKGLREQAAYYLANGARMVWLVLPEKRLVEVWTPDEQLILTVNDTLDGGDVLPGFTLAVKDIFPG